MFDTLVIALIAVFIVWYIQYHWKRRNLYAKASKINGPLTLPFIGNALYFLKSNAGEFKERDNCILFKKCYFRNVAKYYAIYF